jgi:hypothetical protein
MKKTGTTGDQATGGDTVGQQSNQGSSQEMRERFAAMSRGRKIVLIVFIIWAVQAIPKWTAAIVADGETSAAIMTFFITPR